MVIASAISRGLTLEDFEKLTLGQVLDHIITYNNAMIKDDKPKSRKATQADFDNF